MKPHEAYTKLIGHAKETALLGSCASVLSWDQETNMPPAGATEYDWRRPKIFRGQKGRPMSPAGAGTVRR